MAIGSSCTASGPSNCRILDPAAPGERRGFAPDWDQSWNSSSLRLAPRKRVPEGLACNIGQGVVAAHRFATL
jgi:hypothetical protein